MRLHYLVRGSGEPLLLLHGLGSSGADWGFQIAALVPQFQVIVPDLPGCGHSSPVFGECSIGGLAETMWSLMDRLGVANPNVVGFSLGGAVALEMALQRPGAVPRLALINSLASYRIDHWRKWCYARIPVAMIRTLGMKTTARMLAGRSFPERWQRAMRDRAIAVVSAAPIAGYVGLVAALEHWDATPRLTSLRSRTVLIAGELDFPPAAAKRVLAAALGADLVVVRGSRHATPFDAVEATNATLLALLNDSPLPPEAARVRDDAQSTPEWRFARAVAEAHAEAARIPDAELNRRPASTA
jgi:3-oxoadipate enol-lactonase